MPHSFKWAGAAARVMWGYHVAAVLGRWTLQDGQLDADLVMVDALRIAQRPLTIEVPRPKGDPWTWPVVTLDWGPGRLTATLAED